MEYKMVSKLSRFYFIFGMNSLIPGVGVCVCTSTDNIDVYVIPQVEMFNFIFVG